MTVRIRDANAADAAAIANLYGYWVLHGTGTFEAVPPTLEDMANRIAAIDRSGMPWLIAEDANGAFAGYAYASPFRPRTGYRWSVEDSVYVAPERHGKGVGRQLLNALIPRVEATGVRQMLAVIGDSANMGSIALHRAAGFQDKGVFKHVGWKFGRWLDIVLMQRELGQSANTPPELNTGWRP